jgi:DNA-binding MarR family transcriptional regulator
MERTDSVWLNGWSELPSPAGVAEIALRQHASFLVGVIATKLVNAGSALFRTHFDVGFTEWRILMMLSLQGGVTAKEISQVVGVDKAAISRSLRDLEVSGLIKPTSETTDRRSKAFLLTPAGSKMHQRMWVIAREHERRLLAGIRREEVPHLIDMLQRLLNELPNIQEFDPKRP